MHVHLLRQACSDTFASTYLSDDCITDQKVLQVSVQVFAVIDQTFLSSVGFLISVAQPLSFSPSLWSETCCSEESTAEGEGEGKIFDGGRGGA